MIFNKNLTNMNTISLFVIFMCFLNYFTCSEQNPATTAKIIIDEAPLKYSQISTESIEGHSEVKITKSTSKQTESPNSVLKIFEFYQKSQKNVCPCNSELSSIQFSKDELRIPYIEYLEEQSIPSKVVENTDVYLSNLVQKEIQKLNNILVELKKKSLIEVSNNQEKLIEEMVTRSLEEIKKNIKLSIVVPEEIPKLLPIILKKSTLLQNLNKTQRLEIIKTMTFDSLEKYVSNYLLSMQNNKDLNESVFKYFSNENLNEYAASYFLNLEQPKEGVKLIINNGMCYQNESTMSSLRYLRFVDDIWSTQQYSDLFTQHFGKAIWIYKDILNMHLFQNLFDSLKNEDLQNVDYTDIFSRLYNLILMFRVKNNVNMKKISNEKDLLNQLLVFIDSESKSYFVEKKVKEEYLLIKTIIYERLEQLKVNYLNDSFKNEIVVDDGLPLQFYVKRKDLRKLLKKVVKTKKLNVNLNILRWEMDQLKSSEEFNQNSESVLFTYLDKLFDKNLEKEEKEEIMENYVDLLQKSDEKEERGLKYRTLGIRYVYYKFHFNYLLKKETIASKKNAIANIDRVNILRPILEQTFNFMSENVQQRMHRVFKAVEIDDEDFFNKSYLGIQKFFESNIMLIFDKLIVQPSKENVTVVKDMCRQILLDFDNYVSETFKNRKEIRSEIVKQCSKHKDFSEFTSFRLKYFFETVRNLSLVGSYSDYEQKTDLDDYFLEIYSSDIYFREFGTRIENAQFHLVLEKDSFFTAEVEFPQQLKVLKSTFLKSRKTFYDLNKISSLKNLIKFKEILKLTKFKFIYFMEISTILKFFDFRYPSNKHFFEELYSSFKDTPKFYHFNNIYFVLKMQEELDNELSKPELPLISRMTALYKSINVFDESKLKEEHYRTIVLASRIAVIYFYTIDLQLDSDNKNSNNTRAALWSKMQEFLQDVLTKETRRVRIYFFTDYFYENMSSRYFLDDFENVEYNREQFILEGKSENEIIGNKRELVSWAYEYLLEMKYINSPARYLENVIYSFYHELIKSKHFDKAEELKDFMINNALSFHRRNGHKLLNKQLYDLMKELKTNPVIPTQQNYNLVLFNCVSEFIAFMNSPDKKYHNFNSEEVKAGLVKFIYQYFAKNGELNNPKLHMPVTEQYLNIRSYKLTFIISLLSVFKIDFKKVFKRESLISFIDNIEFTSWYKFALDSHKAILIEDKEIDQLINKSIDKLKTDFKPFELNNLTTQNLEGFFKRICLFEDIQANMKFVKNKKSFEKISKQIPECLDLLPTLSQNELKRVIYRLIKVFHNPKLYYSKSIQIFEDDEIDENLLALKKLFGRVTMSANQHISFFDFSQMIQKILLSNAKVVNTNFQEFLIYVSEKFHITDIFKTFDSLFQEKLLNVEGHNQEKLVGYYKNAIMHDMLTLLPLNNKTVKDSKELWQFDFYHLLNMKSNYALFLTNLFQNFTVDNFEVYSKIYFLVCKFKLVKMLKFKKNNKGDKLSLEGSIISVSKIAQNQENLTRKESPEFDSFVRKQMSNESLKEDIIQELYYLKLLNIDTNMVDMSAFEVNEEEFALNLVQDIRNILDSLSLVKNKDKLANLILNNRDLVNNLSFYYQEAKKLNQKIERFGNIDYMFEGNDDEDIVKNHKTYLSSFVDFFSQNLKLKVTDEDSIMYRRNLHTILFKFDAKVVF